MAITLGQLILFMNMIMFLDLWVIIKNPFRSAYQRRKDFTLCSVVVGGLIMLCNFNVVYNHSIWLNENEYQFHGSFAIT